MKKNTLQQAEAAERNQWWNRRIAEIEALEKQEWEREQKAKKVAEAADEVMLLVDDYTSFRMLNNPAQSDSSHSTGERLYRRIRNAVIDYISLGVDS